ATLSGAAASARAQQPAMPVIGYLSTASPGPYTPFLSAFHNGLKEAGYVEGQNVAIEYHWAEGQYGRLPEMAADSFAVGWPSRDESLYHFFKTCARARRGAFPLI